LGWASNSNTPRRVLQRASSSYQTKRKILNRAPRRSSMPSMYRPEEEQHEHSTMIVPGSGSANNNDRFSIDGVGSDFLKNNTELIDSFYPVENGYRYESTEIKNLDGIELECEPIEIGYNSKQNNDYGYQDTQKSTTRLKDNNVYGYENTKTNNISNNQYGFESVETKSVQTVDETNSLFNYTDENIVVCNNMFQGRCRKVNRRSSLPSMHVAQTSLAEKRFDNDVGNGDNCGDNSNNVNEDLVADDSIFQQGNKRRRGSLPPMHLPSAEELPAMPIPQDNNNNTSMEAPSQADLPSKGQSNLGNQMARLDLSDCVLKPLSIDEAPQSPCKSIDDDGEEDDDDVDYNSCDSSPSNLDTPSKPTCKTPTYQQTKERLQNLMEKSADSQKALQDWDAKLGLPKSHSQTMVNTSRSRQQLLENRILPKWNGAPLISNDNKSPASRQNWYRHERKN